MHGSFLYEGRERGVYKKVEKGLKHYNIMTSCDDALAKYIAISITAMMDNFQDSYVDFFSSAQSG